MSGMITPDGTCTVCGKTNVAPNHPFELPQSVTAPTDAVAQAVRNLNRAIGAYAEEGGDTNANGRQIDADIDALIAAVRAECAAKVEALPGMEDDGSPGDWENYLRRGDVLAALEAHP